MPHLRTYWNQLQQVLDDNSQSNALLQEEAYQVHGALLVCYIMWFIRPKISQGYNVTSLFYVAIFNALKVVLSQETSLKLNQTFHVNRMLHGDSRRLNIVNFKVKLCRLVW